MVRLCWPASSASALRRRTCWRMRCCRATSATDELSRVMLVSRGRRTNAGAGDGKKVLPRQAVAALLSRHADQLTNDGRQAAGAPRTSAGTRDHDWHRRGRRALPAGARPCRRRSKAQPLFIGDSAALCTKSLEVLIPILYIKGVSTGGQGCR